MLAGHINIGLAPTIYIRLSPSWTIGPRSLVFIIAIYAPIWLTGVRGIRAVENAQCD